jgi:hypothetical protein
MIAAAFAMVFIPLINWTFPITRVARWRLARFLRVDARSNKFFTLRAATRKVQIRIGLAMQIVAPERRRQVADIWECR